MSSRCPCAPCQTFLATLEAHAVGEFFFHFFHFLTFIFRSFFFHFLSFSFIVFSSLFFSFLFFKFSFFWGAQNPFFRLDLLTIPFSNSCVKN